MADSIRNEMFAVELLMALPSELNKAWAEATNDELPGVIARQIKVLGLTEPARLEAESLMMALAPMRQFYRGVAVSLRDSEYTGDEPHPAREEALAIVQAMQQLDAAAKPGH